jgi:hypothetical protein
LLNLQNEHNLEGVQKPSQKDHLHLSLLCDMC